MSNGFYNNLGLRLGDGTLDWAADTIKWLLLRDTGSYTFDPDHDVVDDILSGGGGVEISVASYARQAMTGKSVTVDDTNDRTKFDGNNVSFGDLETGQTVEAAVCYEEITNDTDSVPLIYFDGKIDIVAAAPVSAPSTGSITNATQANPVVITSSNHGLSDGQKVKITGVVGMTEINDRIFTVANSTTNTFELQGEDGTGHTAYSSGGTWTEVMNVYVDPLDADVADGTSVDFGGGATGLTNGLTTAGTRLIEVADLGAAIDLADVSSDTQSTLNLPAALGGGPYNININAIALFTVEKC